MTDVSVSEQLASIQQLLAIFQAAIDAQTEILRTQTEMLAALWREATKDHGPSAAVQAIERLSAVITTRLDRISAAVEAVAHGQEQALVAE